MNKTIMYKVLIYLIPLASLLSFSVQPIVGKYLLPSQGGSVSSWFIIVLFFQSSLLLGYIIALYINKLSLLLQYAIFLIIALFSGITFNLSLTTTETLSAAGILLFLSVNLLFTMILLFSYSILLQGWLSHANQKVPYHLYAVSSFGSLLGLILYPFLIELFLPLSLQAYIWSTAYYIFLAIIMLMTVILIAGLPKYPKSKLIKTYEPKTDYKKLPCYFLWTVLNLIPCIIFLDITRMLTMEFGNHPLSWIIPLGFYLQSMTFSFSKISKERTLNFYMLCLFAGTMIITFNNILSLKSLNYITLLGYGLIITGGIAGALRLLYFYRPHKNPEYFNSFYICLGIGGVLSGLLISFVFPRIFVRPVEGILSCYILLFIWIFIFFNKYKDKYYTPSKAIIASIAVLILILLATSAYFFVDEKRNYPERTYYRSIYSTYKVDIDREDNFILLISGFVMHGIQLTDDPMLPVAYYSEESALGTWIRLYQENNQSYNMGVIGLGVGVISAYNRDDDTITYFEIDSRVVDIAFGETSFLSESKGVSNIIIEDGRIGIRDHDPFDFIVVDAFSGAGIPHHLITKEALSEYMENSLEKVVILHISNKYWDISPLIKGISKDLGYNCAIIYTASMSVNKLIFPNTVYAVVYKSDISSFLDVIEENTANRIIAPDRIISWSDDFNSILKL